MAALLKNTDVRCRIDEDLKERVTAVLSACGLTISEAMRLFLLQVVETQGLPFEVRAPSDKTARALVQAREIRSRFDSMDELLEDLDGKEAPQTRRKQSTKPKTSHSA
jgi:DNA-damage-inducible protein J